MSSIVCKLSCSTLPFKICGQSPQAQHFQSDNKAPGHTKRHRTSTQYSHAPSNTDKSTPPHGFLLNSYSYSCTQFRGAAGNTRGPTIRDEASIDLGVYPCWNLIIYREKTLKCYLVLPSVVLATRVSRRLALSAAICRTSASRHSSSSASSSSSSPLNTGDAKSGICRAIRPISVGGHAWYKVHVYWRMGAYTGVG